MYKRQVYGILRLINFAHGDVFMVAGLVMVYATASLPIYVSIVLVVVVTVAIGVIIEKVAYKPLRSAPRMSVMISAIGVSYLLQNCASVSYTHLDVYKRQILDWIAAHCHNSFWDAVMPFITGLGDQGILWILLGVLILFFQKGERARCV